MKSYVFYCPTGLSFDAFRIQIFRNPFVQIAIQQAFLPCSSVIRIRGGAPHYEHVNNEKHFNEIPYLTNIKFLWNGRPCIDFNLKVMFQIDNGLGSVTVGNNTLLSTAKLTDEGGVLGNPSAAACAVMGDDGDNIMKLHIVRVHKLFACLLNYIDPKSQVYLQYMNDFNGDGLAVYHHIQTFGRIRTPTRIVRAREDVWNQMTMEKLKIGFTTDGIFAWAEAVQQYGRILNKSGELQRDKFCSGFPSFFANVVEVIEKDEDASLRFPPLIGGDPAFALHPNRANAHPRAGQFDVLQAARKYLPRWVVKISDVNRFMPSEMLKSTICIDTDEFLNLLAADVTPQMICTLCGGKGHAASFFLKDGTKQVCATKIARIENGGESAKSMSGDEILHQIDGDDDTKSDYDLDAMTDAINSLKEELAYTKQIAKKTYHNNFRSRSHSTSTANNSLASDMHDESEQDDVDDSASDASAHSLVNTESMFANSFAPKRSFSFKRRGSKKA